MQNSFRSTGWFFLLLFSSLPAAADTRLVFPRVVFQRGLFSGIAVSNPTAGPATIKLTAYNPDGTKLSTAGTRNEVVPPAIGSGGQYLTLAGQVFDPNSLLAGAAAKYCWVEVISTTSGLAGFYIEGDDIISYQYGGDLGAPGTDLYLPAVENTGTAVTEISLVNADTSDNGGIANITVDFVRSDGQKVTSRNATLAKAASLQGPLSGIAALSLPSFDQVASLRIRSDRPLFCHGMVKTQSGKTPIVLPAEDATTPARVLYFPQLAEGGGWTTSLGITNLNFLQQRIVTISAYKPDGTLYTDSRITNPCSAVLGPGGFLRKTFSELFPFSDTSYKEGWIKVEADSPSISGYIEYGWGRNRTPVIAQLRSLQQSMFSHQAQASPYFTGLAILNPGTLAANVEIFSLDSKGAPWGMTQIVLKPGQRISRLLYQIVNSSSEKTGGSVFVRSDFPVISTELFAKNDVTALANVPPQQVTESFDPNGPPKILPIPALAVLETGKSQVFSAPSASAPEWSVNGIKGGNASIGTVSGSGVYQAPAKSPDPRTVTVQATSGASSGASTVDIVQREQLTGGLTVVTAVAYHESLQRFFVAEQKIVSPAPSTVAAQANTQISEVIVTAGGTTNVAYFSITGDTIAKMLPWDSPLGGHYLLLAGRDSGKIYRLDIATKVLKTVVSGLQQPTSMALDASTGNLLVAEAGAQRITIVTAGQVVSASGPGATPFSPDGKEEKQALPAPAIQGITVDRCTGAVYFSTTAGELIEYKGGAQRIVETGLNRPTQLHAFWRVGFPCPAALAIGIVESDRISLSYPNQQIKRITLVGEIQSLQDVLLLPQGNPFSSKGEVSVCVSQSSSVPSQGQVADVPVGGAFRSTPPENIESLRGLYAGTGPSADPPGDTLDTGLAAQQGYEVPDIVSVTGSKQDSQSWITIKFAKPVTILGPYLGPGLGFAGLRGYIFMRTGGNPVLSQYPLSVASYFPFSDPSTYQFDSYIWISPGVGYGFVSSSGQNVPLKLSAIGDAVTFSFSSSAFNLDTTRAVVLMGNPGEITDVAPNNGLLSLSTLPLVF